MRPMTYPRPFPGAERFWAKVQKSDGCWEWQGSRADFGYGVLARVVAGRMLRLRAHRVAYELMVGPIPDGLVLDHLCRNPPCVNPAHLEAVTDGVNTLRATVLPIHCPHGHRYTGKTDNRGDRVCVECVRIKNARRYRGSRRSA